MRATVDHDRCVGTTMCVLAAPELFELDPQGQAVATTEVTAAREAALDAAGQCPMEAITVVDEASGETLFP